MKKDHDKLIQEFRSKFQKHKLFAKGAWGFELNDLEAFLLEKVEAKESEMSIKAHHIWLYLDQLQKAPGGNVSVEEWNLLETIKEKIEQFMKDGSNYIPLDEGHSGNTWSAAQRLAYYYITNPINVYMEHGVGTPLVGCEDYGCIHPRPQLSSNPTPQKEEHE